MDIIDHGHKNRCAFSMIPVGECFRSSKTGVLFIKTRGTFGATAASLCDGADVIYDDNAIVYTVKAHIEVE